MGPQPVNENGPTVEDLPPRERRRAQLPPLLSIILLIVLAAVAVLGYSAQQRDAQRRDFERQTLRTQELALYAINANACRARALINKNIRDLQAQLATYIQAAADPSASSSARARNAGRISDAQTSITGLRKFRDLYVTVPPGFDCRTLPPKPPRSTG